MRTKTAAASAIFLSVLIHLLILGGSVYFWFPGAAILAEETMKLFDVNLVDLKPAQPTEQTVIQDYVEKIKFETPEPLSDSLNPSLIPPEDIAAPEMTAPVEEREVAVDEKGPDLVPEEKLDLRSEDADPKRRTVLDRDTAVEIDVLKLLPEAGGLDAAALTPPGVAGRGISGYSPESLGGTGPVALAGDPAGPALKAAPRYESIEEFLSVGVSTHWDPAENAGYCRIAIRPNRRAKEMQVMPKELVFLVDASMSIRRRRLEEFRQGIYFALANLNGADRFNIIAFKGRTNSLFAESQPAGPASLAAARSFLEGLDASQQTDIYGAFYQSVYEREPVILPSYMVLLSDGKPTFQREPVFRLIGRISKLNAGKRAIFSSSGGGDVNRFLLDFLAYQNRGWSEVTADTALISPKMKEFYLKIRNPVLREVRYQISRLEAGEVYPKRLPDFFRDTEFVLYARYLTPGKFSMRILGKAGSGPREMIFVRDLAEAPAGGEMIARQWALSKIYSLLGQMTEEGAGPAGAKAEIESLMARYGIPVPYNLNKILPPD